MNDTITSANYELNQIKYCTKCKKKGHWYFEHSLMYIDGEEV